MVNPKTVYNIIETLENNIPWDIFGIPFKSVTRRIIESEFLLT